MTYDEALARFKTFGYFCDEYEYSNACDYDCKKCDDMKHRMIEALKKMKELSKGIADMEDTLNDAYTLNDFCLNKVIRKQPMSECECIAESFSLKAMQNLDWLLGVIKRSDEE